MTTIAHNIISIASTIIINNMIVITITITMITIITHILTLSFPVVFGPHNDDRPRRNTKKSGARKSVNDGGLLELSFYYIFFLFLFCAKIISPSFPLPIKAKKKRKKICNSFGNSYSVRMLTRVFIKGCRNFSKKQYKTKKEIGELVIHFQWII